MDSRLNICTFLQKMGRVASCGIALSSVACVLGQTQLPNLAHSGFKWRNIGPFRGGRISAVSGVIGEPGTFYVGLPMGGVWKTTDAGVTWYPIFDKVKSVSTIGSVAVAPSDPKTIYVGTGDMIIRDIARGNGMYKSFDAGKTWHHIGLDGTNQIPSLLVDPHDPNLVIAATLGSMNHKSSDRGIFRTIDGGKTWKKTLFIDNETGIEQLAWDPGHPKTIFAVTLLHYRKPGTNPFFMRGKKKPVSKTFIYKSTDEGLTWTKVLAKTLPKLDGRTSIAVAMNTDDRRVFFVENAGLWTSDNGGKTWKQMDKTDPRVRNGQGGYNCGVYVSPSDPKTVYVINTCSYVSRDGGKTFTGFKGAPGGDDPQQMWIDPTDSRRILLGMDQGATISFNGGKTWSSWYNQPTGQYYHIAVDNQSPYWVYGTEQDSGSIATSSRGILGEITPFDWSTEPGYEFGYIVPDPLHVGTIYASGPGGGIIRAIFPSGQWEGVSPSVDSSLHLRHFLNQPLVFSPTNPHELFAGFQCLMSTTDGGLHWRKLSPDLSHPKGWKPPLPKVKTRTKVMAKVPQKGGKPHPKLPPKVAPRPNPFGGASIECIAPSRINGNLIWVGTTNGLIKVTQNHGRSWQDASIPKIPTGTHADISSLDASPFDPAEAYAAVDTHNMNDDGPHFYRTTNYGKSWTEINNGLPTNEPSGSFSRVLRCDLKAKGLLFAGTESSVYVSLDDGDNWQSLAINLPNTSYRDLVVHGNDLVAGTFGRAIWVLDDITPLRQMAEFDSTKEKFFKPEVALRIRRNVGQDTPLPPEVPHGENPPEGAVFDYYLPSDAMGGVQIAIKDSSGNVVRTLSNVPAKNWGQKYPPEPNFWLAKQHPLPTAAGFHRAIWDLRMAPPATYNHGYDISANPGETKPSPRGPMVLPGKYSVTFTAGGSSFTEPLTIVNDPHSPGTMSAMETSFKLETSLYNSSRIAYNDASSVTAMRKKVAALIKTKPTPDILKAATALDKKLGQLEGMGGGMFFFRPGPPPPPNFRGVVQSMDSDIQLLDSSDLMPSEPMMMACKEQVSNLAKAEMNWKNLQSHDIASLNQLLQKAGLPSL